MATITATSSPDAAELRPTLANFVRSKGSFPKLYLTDLLLPVAVTFWAIGVHSADVKKLGPYGLAGAVPAIFYAGVGVLALSFVIGLRREQPGTSRMALHAVAMVMMLYAPEAIVYPVGRYPWLYKLFGVVQYVNVHGGLDRHIDIYQNWPGFFAAIAWLDKVAGVGSPLGYAKWAQPAFELAALPLLYVIFGSLGLSVRQRWIAILLYSSCNWISQDYLSPQGLGTLLSLGALAIACRWLLVERAPARRKLFRRGEATTSIRQSDGPPPASTREVAVASVAVTLIFFVLTFTHELSPYIVVVQLGTLAIVGLMRPRWLPLVLGAIAIGYLLPRLSFVNAKYGLLDSIGSFFGNLRPPKAPTAAGGGLTASGKLINDLANSLSGLVWALALLGIWMRRRAGRPVLGLALLAFSPGVVLFITAYGNEGILRVYLFSLPWSVALASCALVPEGARAREAGLKLAYWIPSLLRSWISAVEGTWNVVRTAAAKRRLTLSMTCSGGVLVVALALFFPTFYGNDAANVMPLSEVSTITSFYKTAKPGPVFVADASAPLYTTDRYPLFPTFSIFDPGGVVSTEPTLKTFVSAVSAAAISYTGGKGPSYVVIAPSMLAYNQEYLLTPQENFAVLNTELSQSPQWKLIVRRKGTVIYELPAASVSRRQHSTTSATTPISPGIPHNVLGP
ncbi:MAG: hypothetical protein WCF24_02515 [Acidimicrobiales bacterium]